MQGQLKPQDYVCRLLNYMKPTTALARAMETPKSTPRAPGPALALVMPLAIGSSDLNDVILRATCSSKFTRGLPAKHERRAGDVRNRTN